jgi:hypothetical protein
MSSPILALNPTRSHDHAIAVAAVVPLSRRAQQYSDALAGEPVQRRAQPEERADKAHDLPDDLPIADGNLFAVAGRVEVASQAMRHGSEQLLRAATSGPTRVRPDDAAVRAGRAASDRHVLAAPSPATLPAAKGAPVAQAESPAPLPTAGMARVDESAALEPERPLRSSPLPPAANQAPAELPNRHQLPGYQSLDMPAPPSPDVAPFDARAGTSQTLPLRSPPATKDAPSIQPLIDGRAVEPAASPRHETPRTSPDKPMPLLHAAGQAPAQLRTGEVRHPSSRLAAARPGPAQAELPASGPAQRMATVSVPFSSWGPGHHVTASWIPAAASGQLPPMTLRSSSEFAQRAIGSALAASDPSAPGSLQLTAADSADDGTSGRRQAQHVPEDEE